MEELKIHRYVVTLLDKNALFSYFYAKFVGNIKIEKSTTKRRGAIMKRWMISPVKLFHTTKKPEQ